jgi:phosphonate transport system substrate-binding protein
VRTFTTTAVKTLFLLIPFFLSSCDPRNSDVENLTVMVVPTDGGTSDGAMADFQPLFDAVARDTGVTFKLSVGTSYISVVEAMAAGKVDVAFFGPVSFLLAKERGAAELLAVGVRDGRSEYFSLLLADPDSNIETVGDLVGSSVAFGDVNSTSSFNVPVKLLMDAGIDPPKDLGKVLILGNHSSALQAVAAGTVDAAFASADSYERFLNNTANKASDFKVIAKSKPIPYPPLAINPRLDYALKNKIRRSIHNIHKRAQDQSLQLRGYAGKPLDKFDAYYDEDAYVESLSSVATVNTAVKEALIGRALGDGS